MTFALLVAMRLLTPAGFMPDWGGSQFRVSLCGDFGSQIAAPGHRGHDKTEKTNHRQPCPYAAASALPFLDAPEPVIPLPADLRSLSPSGTHLVYIIPRRKIERPPSRAPPVLA